MAKQTKEDALLYHSMGKPGKIEVVPTKPYSSQRDLSLAYSPGVAEPCLEIEKNPDCAYEYTAKGNLVAVISNGTAVLGLGNIGAMSKANASLGRNQRGRFLSPRKVAVDAHDLCPFARENERNGAAVTDRFARLLPCPDDDGAFARKPSGHDQNPLSAGSSVCPSSSWTPKLLSIIETCVYWPTVNMRSIF